MKSRAFVFAALLLATVSLSAQDSENKESIAYSNITEFGFVAASPRGFAWEGTTVNGFSIDKRHCLGLGLGFGYLLQTGDDEFFSTHTPVFLNYRVYFRPEKPFSPHVNIAMGGVIVRDGGGLYSALTMGFKSKKFTFSSGFSFMAIKGEKDVYGYDDWEYYHHLKTVPAWYYPFGIVLKCGFTF